MYLISQVTIRLLLGLADPEIPPDVRSFTELLSRRTLNLEHVLQFHVLNYLPGKRKLKLLQADVPCPFRDS